MSTPAPGWYDDGHGRHRYWDGVRWTEHVADAAAPGIPRAPVAVPPAARSAPSLKGLWIALIVLGAVILVGAAAAVALMFAFPRSSPDQTVRDYNSAWHDGNCDAITRLTTESWKTSYAFDCGSVEAASSAPWDLRLVSVEIDSDVARVEYTVTGVADNGQSFSQSYDARLVEHGGVWLIDSDDLVSSP